METIATHVEAVYAAADCLVSLSTQNGLAKVTLSEGLF